MKAWINLYVDMSDLDIDYKIERYSERSEYWGMIRDDDYVDIDIRSVKYNGVETDDYDVDAVENYILEVLEDGAI